MYSIFVIFCSFLGYFIGYEFCNYIHDDELEKEMEGVFDGKFRKSR